MSATALTTRLKANRAHRIKRTTEDYVVDTVIMIFMVLTFIITFYPFFYVIIMSLNDGIDALKGGIYFWPRSFTLDNYAKFLSDDKWISAIFVSVGKTFIGTVSCVFFTCMVAYGMSFPNLALRKVYNLILLFCMY
ncbi:MAG: hypothetical protein RR276_07525, partial [Angelakisella sp.]